MKYKIVGTDWDGKLRYFRVDKGHKNIEFLTRMTNFVFQKRYIPSGFYTLDPSVGVPEQAEKVILDYTPHFQLKENQWKIWIRFNEFIGDLDTAYILDSSKIDLKRVAPYDFLMESNSFKWDDLGASHHSSNLVAPNMGALMKLADQEDQAFYDSIEIVAICKLLFYEATEMFLKEDEEGNIIRMHWKVESFHQLFVDLIMVTFVKFFFPSTFSRTIHKALQLPDLKQFEIDLVRIKENQAGLFIMHYINHLEEYDNFEKASNYALSKLAVDKFNL